MNNTPTELEASADRNLTVATQAMLQCLEGIRDSQPELIADHMPKGWGMHRIRDAFKQHQSQQRDEAKRIVDQLTYGAQRSSWEQSASFKWQYATLTIRGHDLRVGVSTGGVVSFEGDPFVPSSRVLCTSLETACQSLNERLMRMDKAASAMRSATAPAAEVSTL
ncbi:hypothetical protein LJR129_005086 [Acidovorax sp. LjRoot129]|uniref:hypothetical protein n=1 Tax=unclassified Acidovorax TaxID=2684926 RepID=UPI003ED003F3